MSTDKDGKQNVFAPLNLPMNNTRFSIRNLVTIAALFFGALTVTRADNLNYTSVTVTNVNQKARTFTVHWTSNAKSTHGMGERYGGSSRERVLITNDKTTYFVGANKGSWANVTKGAHVSVTAHSEAAGKVADRVQILAGS
jgi:hypothetical protein